MRWLESGSWSVPSDPLLSGEACGLCRQQESAGLFSEILWSQILWKYLWSQIIWSNGDKKFSKIYSCADSSGERQDSRGLFKIFWNLMITKEILGSQWNPMITRKSYDHKEILGSQWNPMITRKSYDHKEILWSQGNLMIGLWQETIINIMWNPVLCSRFLWSNHMNIIWPKNYKKISLFFSVAGVREIQSILKVLKCETESSNMKFTALERGAVSRQDWLGSFPPKTAPCSLKASATCTSADLQHLSGQLC